MDMPADWTAPDAQQADAWRNVWVKYAAGGLLIVAAVALLVYSSIRGNSQYFLSVREIRDRAGEMVGKDVRVSGIVVPDSIVYEPATLHLEFDVVDQGDPGQKALRIVMDGEPLPDQMKDQAEAVAEGRLQPDGTFGAETLMMKCASKYDASPAVSGAPATED